MEGVVTAPADADESLPARIERGRHLRVFAADAILHQREIHLRVKALHGRRGAFRDDWKVGHLRTVEDLRHQSRHRGGFTLIDDRQCLHDDRGQRAAVGRAQMAGERRGIAQFYGERVFSRVEHEVFWRRGKVAARRRHAPRFARSADEEREITEVVRPGVEVFLAAFDAHLHLAQRATVHIHRRAGKAGPLGDLRRRGRERLRLRRGILHHLAVETVRRGVPARFVGIVEIPQRRQSLLVSAQALEHGGADFLAGARRGPDPHFIDPAGEPVTRSIPPADVGRAVGREIREAEGSRHSARECAVEIKPRLPCIHDQSDMAPFVRGEDTGHFVVAPSGENIPPGGLHAEL